VAGSSTVIALPLLLGALGALLQVSVLPAFYAEPWATPLLPCALLAAWAATRRPEESWPIALASALVLGVASVERSGWFLLALLPTFGAGLALGLVSPRHHHFVARLGRATATAATGAVCYLGTLALASGSVVGLGAAVPAVVLAGVGTAVIAAIAMVALIPLRPRPVGLFS
jgi:hypothetical protein